MTDTICVYTEQKTIYVSREKLLDDDTLKKHFNGRIDCNYINKDDIPCYYYKDIESVILQKYKLKIKDVVTGDIYTAKFRALEHIIKCDKLLIELDLYKLINTDANIINCINWGHSNYFEFFRKYVKILTNVYISGVGFADSYDEIKSIPKYLFPIMKRQSYRAFSTYCDEKICENYNGRFFEPHDNKLRFYLPFHVMYLEANCPGYVRSVKDLEIRTTGQVKSKSIKTLKINCNYTHPIKCQNLIVCTSNCDYENVEFSNYIITHWPLNENIARRAKKIICLKITPRMLELNPNIEQVRVWQG